MKKYSSEIIIATFTILIATCIIALAWKIQNLEREAVKGGHAHFNYERKLIWNTCGS